MRSSRFCGLGVVLGGLGFAQLAAADIFLDQQIDFRGFSPSEQDTAVPYARTADDYWYNGGGKPILESVTVWMIVTFPNIPESFRLEQYEGRQRPESLFQTFEMISAKDRGEWDGRDDLHLIEVTFDARSFMSHGRMWLSPYAIGNGSGTDRAWWATAGNGDIRQKEGHFISEHFGVPEWTKISDSGILDFPTDFAMRIEATIPAPAGIVVMGVAFIRSRRRR